MKRSVIIVAAAIFLITHAANLQVPLYTTHAKIAGFGSGISAIAFSTYIDRGLQLQSQLTRYSCLLEVPAKLNNHRQFHKVQQGRKRTWTETLCLSPDKSASTFSLIEEAVS